MKNPILYYMKFDDKYWALFLIGVFVLLYMETCVEEKKKNIMSVVGYAVVAYLLVYCVPIYPFLIKVFPQMNSYYELGYVIPMIPVIAIAATKLVLHMGEGGYLRRLYMVVGAVVLLSFAGDFAYIPSNYQTSFYDCTEEEKEIFDMILVHASEQEKADEVYIWGMPDLMMKSRFYDASMEPIYKKDIMTAPQNYSVNLQSMYERYEKYIAPQNEAVRLMEYLNVIAFLPYMYEEMESGYVIIYDPEWQLAQAGKEIELKKEEVLEIFEGNGYEFVGSTQQKIVFCKPGEGEK